MNNLLHISCINRIIFEENTLSKKQCTDKDNYREFHCEEFHSCTKMMSPAVAMKLFRLK